RYPLWHHYQVPNPYSNLTNWNLHRSHLASMPHPFQTPYKLELPRKYLEYSQTPLLPWNTKHLMPSESHYNLDITDLRKCHLLAAQLRIHLHYRSSSNLVEKVLKYI